MADINTDKLLQIILKEHRELSEQIADLSRFWEEVNELGQGPKYEEMASRVQSLRRHLAAHFADEEQGGYLAPSLQQAPQFSTQAKALEHQHAQFLDTLDHFIDHLQKCQSAFHCWQEVRTEFDEFLKQLYEHELAETNIVTTAYNKEVSKSD